MSLFVPRIKTPLSSFYTFLSRAPEGSYVTFCYLSLDFVILQLFLVFAATVVAFFLIVLPFSKRPHLYVRCCTWRCVSWFYLYPQSKVQWQLSNLLTR